MRLRPFSLMMPCALVAIMKQLGRLTGGRRSIGLAVLATALVGGVTGYTAGATGHTAIVQAHASRAGTPLAALAPRAVPAALAPFAATGLPAGPATGMPQHLFLPAGFTLKHTHGGPTYVYVISGTLIISDAAGVKTYRAGSFFAEPPGHVHTVHTARPAEIFVLSLLPPGADATIPVK